MTALGPGQPLSIGYRTFVQGHPLRPLLVMRVTGPNGNEFAVWGIVDSGADSASFPYEWATLLGYTSATLKPEQFGQVGGTATGSRAQVPSTAVVPEYAALVVPMTPLFVQGSQVILWGRQDFMRCYDVTIHETQQTFEIVPC